MARLDIAVDHGQDPETAHANFERAITAAITEHGRWIKQCDWALDRKSVKLSGSGFEVVVSHDDHKVLAQGVVPWGVKLLEKPIRAFVARALATKS